jgi:nitrate reductase gamma subunit
MIKEILAVLKTVAICTGGVLALIGLRYFATTIRILSSPLHVLIQILIGVALLVGAITIWCKWYLNKKSDEDEQRYQDRQNWN